jgi:hypothetical protein
MILTHEEYFVLFSFLMISFKKRLQDISFVFFFQNILEKSGKDPGTPD